MVLVSVIMPCYNKASFLPAAIESVMDQEFDDWELIIIDDHSSDASPQIIRSYQHNEPRIRSLINETGTRGGSVCRNIGLREAQGPFTVFFDADDLLATHCLEQRAQAMTSQPDLEFAVFPMQTFFQAPGDSTSMWNRFQGNHLRRFLMHDLPWQTMMPIWKTETLRRLGGFDENFQRLQDVELHTRALLDSSVSYHVFSEKKPDCYYRIEEGRVETGYFDYMHRKVSGVSMYIEKFYRALDQADRSGQIRLLKGTVFEMIAQLYVASRSGLISEAEHRQLAGSLLRLKEVRSMLTSKDRLALGIFHTYQATKVHIPGAHFAVKRLLLI